MKIDIISANGYRLNEYFADLILTALKCTHNCSRSLRDNSDLVIMTNGVGINDQAYKAIASGKPILYLHDEIQASIPLFENVLIASQYQSFGDTYFQVSSLCVFDDLLYTTKYVQKAEYEFVYWGHPKAGRYELYESLPDNPSCLYIGEWESHKPDSVVVPYTRDRDELLSLISKGRSTITEGGELEERHKNIPLRVYEALIAGVEIIDDMSYREAYDLYVLPKEMVYNDLINLIRRVYNECR